MAKKVQDALKDIISLCKRRGFIFPGSEIYDGLANTWDYGPYGVELKRNIKNLWWKKFVTSRHDVLGLDSSILLNPRVWKASGHVGNFSDPLVDCLACHERFRADQLLEEKLGEGCCAGKNFDEVHQMMVDNKIECPTCGKTDWTKPRAFNLMFQTEIGVIEGEGNKVYLRPETAQGIFVDFRNIVDNVRPRIPFGVGQIGKSFRNEITPGNFIFRTREFEQMELEFFCEPGTELEWYDFWRKYCFEWLVNDLGVKREKLRLREHAKEELSHYSNGTTDVEYEFPFGWGELWGIASRTNYDLTQPGPEQALHPVRCGTVSRCGTFAPRASLQRLRSRKARKRRTYRAPLRSEGCSGQGCRAPAREEGQGQGKGRRTLPEAPQPLERRIRRNAVHR